MNVYRCGENGNLLKVDGGMMVVELHARDIFRVLNGGFSVQRYMEFRHNVYGFPMEDKFGIWPLEPEDVERDARHRTVMIDMDPGGDIALRLSEQAGVEAIPYRASDFDIAEICDQPGGFIDRGLHVMRIMGLSALEAERIDKSYWPALWQQKAEAYL